MGKNAVYTFPNPQGGWVNKFGDFTLSSYTTKDAAIKLGKNLARKHQTKHYIYNQYGKLIIIDDYSVTPHRMLKLEGIFQ